MLRLCRIPYPAGGRSTRASLSASHSRRPAALKYEPRGFLLNTSNIIKRLSTMVPHKSSPVPFIDHYDVPLVSFGVLTDVQYADCENRPSWCNPDITRFYRTSLNHIDHAFAHWQQQSVMHPVGFVLQLGDLIDGLNRGMSKSLLALERALQRFEKHPNIPTFHAVGNHELYNFSRSELANYFQESLERMNIPLSFMGLQQINTRTEQSAESPDTSSPSLYYKFCPVAGVKFIGLDCFEISAIGYEPSHPNYKKAEEILFQHHGHYNIENWDCDDHLQGVNKRFLHMNGAVSEEQLNWLENELAESDRLGQKVVVFGHVGLLPGSCDITCLLWNYEDVISTFHRHHCVAAYFCGHTHAKGYAMDSRGIHYVAFAGIVEASPEDLAFATVLVYDNRLEIVGFGREESHTLPLASSEASRTSKRQVSSTSDVERGMVSSTPSVKVHV